MVRQLKGRSQGEPSSRSEGSAAEGGGDRGRGGGGSGLWSGRMWGGAQKNKPKGGAPLGRKIKRHK